MLAPCTTYVTTTTASATTTTTSAFNSSPTPDSCYTYPLRLHQLSRIPAEETIDDKQHELVEPGRRESNVSIISGCKPQGFNDLITSSLSLLFILLSYIDTIL